MKLRRANPLLDLDRTPLTKLAEETLEHAEQLRRWGEALSSADDELPGSQRAGASPLQAAHHLLVDLVHDKELHATQRVFLLLELINGDPFDDIWRGLRSNNPKAHASSLELLENLVQQPLRGRILELVGEKVELAPAETGAAPPLSYEEAIREILAHRSTTMRTLAEYRAIELGIDPATVPRVAGPERANPFAESLGEKLLVKVRDALVPDAMEGATRAPA